jgi:nicotinic acid mononucleotide adenylyltransferase
MKIGLYFGTFNPPCWHLIIANHMAEHSDLDQIWMVVTPHNPLKKKKHYSMITISLANGASCQRIFQNQAFGY